MLEHEREGVKMKKMLIHIFVVSFILLCISTDTIIMQVQSDKNGVEVPHLIYEIIDSVEAEQPSPLFSNQINELEKLLSEDPTNIQVRLSLASSYEMSFVFSKALDHYLKAAEQAPDKADPFIGLGRLYYNLAILDMSNRNLTSTSPTGLVLFHPDEKAKEVLLLAKEMFLISKEKEPLGFFSPDTADEFLLMIEFKLIMSAAPEIWWLSEGANLIKEGKYKEAIDALNKAVEMDPNCAEAYFNRGLAYGKLGRHEKAIEDFSEAIKLNPNYADAYYNRAAAYFYLKKYSKTMEDCNEVIEIASPGSEVYIDAIYLHELARKKLSEQSPIPTLILLTPLTTPPKTTPTPGFEAIFAIAGLLAVAYLLIRKIF